MDSADCKGVLREVLMALKREVAPQPYRVLLKVLKLAVSKALQEGHFAGVHALNTREFNFRSVDYETELLRQLIYLLGYEGNRMFEEQVILSDFYSSQPRLRAFCELALEEISCTPCPDIEHLKQINNTSLLVAHLAYNFRMRVELMILHTPTVMMEIGEEDILKGIECIDYLAERMGLMRSPTDHYSLWTFVKEQIRKHVVTRGAYTSTEEIRGAMMAIGNQLAVELNERFGAAVAHIFPYTYTISLVMSAAVNLVTWDRQTATIYLEVCSCIPPRYYSRKYFESIERLRPLLMQSRGQNLSESDLKTVCNITTWQSRNFIYHVQSDPCAVLHHSESLQRSVSLHNGHHSHSGSVILQRSLPVDTPILAQSNEEEKMDKEKMDGGKKDTAPKEVGTDHDRVENKVRLKPSDHPSESAAARGLSSDLKGPPFVEDSGFIQDDLSDSPVVETLRQQLHHSKSTHTIHWESEVDNLIQDARERCKQISQDVKDLTDAISTVSDPVVIQPLQEEAEEKQKQMEEEHNELVLLNQLKDELRRLQESQQAASVVSRFCLLLRPGFINCQLKKIVDSCCTDHIKLQALMDCAIDLIPAEVLESLTMELGSFEYKHPDNRHCQQILVAELSRRLLVM